MSENKAGVIFKILGITIASLSLIGGVSMAYINSMAGAIKTDAILESYNASRQYTDERILETTRRIERMEDRIIEEIRKN